METYGKILLVAMPAFLVLVLFEKWWGWYKGYDTVRNMDMISSLTSGVTNVTKDVLGLAVAIISYEWLVSKVALTHIPTNWLTYVIVFIVIDFSGYVVHAIDHKVNFFWNSHMIHHSSEEFNLACALRQSISVFVRFFVILLLPAALLGIDSKVIAVVAPIQLFAQFWYHTRQIGKMGFLESFMVTPSHHRVHHAQNKEYIDKNFGQIFIVWDKMFGTFQKELPEIPPVYGVTRPVRTWNPIRINFQHIALLIQDAIRTHSLKDKLRIWFMPAGWRPADVVEKYPIEKIEDPYHFKKYNPPSSHRLMAWSWVQLIILLGLISYLFGNIAGIDRTLIFVYGAFVFLYVYAMTDLMDRSRYAVWWDGLKSISGITLMIVTGGWFGLEHYLGSSVYLMALYFIASPFIANWFMKNEPVYESTVGKEIATT